MQVIIEGYLTFWLFKNLLVNLEYLVETNRTWLIKNLKSPSIKSCAKLAQSDNFFDLINFNSFSLSDVNLGSKYTVRSYREKLNRIKMN